MARVTPTLTSVPAPPPDQPAVRRPARQPWTALAAVAAVGAVTAGLALFGATAGAPPDSAATAEPHVWAPALRHLPLWGAWFLLTPAVLRLARRFPVGDGLDRRHVLVHALVLLALIGASAASVALATAWLAPVARGMAGPLATGAGACAPLPALYALLVGAEHLAAQRRRETQLRRQLAEANLRQLRAQLEPHFLFNALHSVYALMEEDGGRAKRMIVELADLLRAAVDDHERQEIALARELELLHHYVEVQRVRHDSRLALSVDLEAGMEGVAVPPLLLQPLVENAIHHGFGGGGRLEVQVLGRCRRGIAQVLVRDDGRGFPGRGIVEGVGLQNTRRRLESLYGAAASLRAGSSPQGGFEVELRWPAVGRLRPSA